MPRIPLLIFPCNGNALEAVDCLGDNFELLGFIDDSPEKRDHAAPTGHPVFGREALSRLREARVLAVPGSPASFRQRRAVIEGLGLEAARLATVVHPRATISAGARVGHNTLVMAGVVMTMGSSVGNHACVLPNTVIHHDSSVGDFSLVGSNVVIAGGATIGAGCYVGSGSNIMNGIHVADGTLVGLGTNLVRDTGAGQVVYGNPGRAAGGRG